MGNCLSTPPESYNFSKGKKKKAAGLTRAWKGACQHFNRNQRASSVMGFRGANAGRENHHVAGAGANRKKKNARSAQFPVDTWLGFARDMSSKYDLEYEVGRGHFGHTCAATIKKGERKGERVAVKVIPKARLETKEAVEDVMREVLILKSLVGHENVVSFYEAQEDSSNVYIVMELCLGGELLDRMLAKGGVYTEKEARPVIRQMLKILTWFQAHGIVHRDLKPENFLFATTDRDATLKVIDFGLSEFVPMGGRLADIVGSAYYVAPEVLKQSYSVEADLWSVGVICYTLLCGGRPFFARSESEVFESVLQADPCFEGESWAGVSPFCIDFIKKLLTKNSSQRISAVQALCHPWMTITTSSLPNDTPSRSLRPPPPPPQDVPLDTRLIPAVQAFSWMDRDARAALQAVAQTLKEVDLVYHRSQFHLLDFDGDGLINVEDFKRAIRLAMLQGRDGSSSCNVLIGTPAGGKKHQNPLLQISSSSLGSAVDKRTPPPPPPPPPLMPKALRHLLGIADGMNKAGVDGMNFRTFVSASICVEQLMTDPRCWEKRRKKAYRVFSCTARSCDAAWKNGFLPEMMQETSAATTPRSPYQRCSHRNRMDGDVAAAYRLTEEEFEQILLTAKSSGCGKSSAEETPQKQEEERSRAAAYGNRRCCGSEAGSMELGRTASALSSASSSASASSAA